MTECSREMECVERSTQDSKAKTYTLFSQKDVHRLFFEERKGVCLIIFTCKYNI